MTPDLILGAVFLVLALTFPVLFHLVHLGSTFLPLFFPIALAGLLVRPGVAATVGLLAPILSGVLTGMPPFYPPIAPQMAAEGAVLGGSIALLRRHWGFGVVGSLVGGILAQRVVLAALVFLIAPLFHLPPGIYTGAKIVSGIPGLILQLVGIPPLVKLLEPRIRQMWEVA
ncbi:MAG: hypothetical protein ABIA75_14800 [Candidatus Neomarinimicrobiota bacterium]